MSLEIQKNDEVKFTTPNHGMFVKYGVVVSATKSKIKVEDESGKVWSVPKKNVWWN